MFDTIELPADSGLEINFANFKDILRNVHVEVEIQAKSLSNEDCFQANHQSTHECLKKISQYKEAGLIACFLNSEGEVNAIEKMLCGSLDEIDFYSRQVLLFEILKRKKIYEAESLVLIHNLVDEAILTTADSWLFKRLKMNFWQQTYYFVNAKDNCLCLDLEPWYDSE